MASWCEIAGELVWNSWRVSPAAGLRPLLKTLPLEMTRYKYVNLGVQYLIIITVNILQLLILCVVSLTE